MHIPCHLLTPTPKTQCVLDACCLIWQEPEVWDLLKKLEDAAKDHQTG